MSIEERIEIARKAIMYIRKRKGTEAWVQSQKFPLTYGCYGLLDYIEHGKPEKILELELQRTVELIIAGKIQLSRRSE